MEVSELLKIVETRMKIDDSNPTSKSFLYELHKALTELQELQGKGEQSNASANETKT